MTKPLPKWIMQKYSELWVKMKDKQFEHPQADKILKQNTSIIIMHLRKKGWLEANLNEKDARKRIYKLKSPEKAMEEMAR